MEKKYFETKKGSVEEKINTIASKEPTINATYKPDVKLSTEKKYFETKKGSIEELAGKLIESKLDPVNKDAVKKKFDDRKDKDIDNDGDTDSTDKYLHKRRAAVSKNIKENPLMALGRTAAAAAGTAAGTAVGNKIGDKITSQKKYNKEDKDPCWKDYKMVGMKKKNGKEVPNCVPKEEKVEEACWDGYKQVGMKNKGGKEVPNCVPDKDNKIPKQKKQNEAVTQDDKGEKQNAHKKDFVQLRQETKLVRLGKNGKTDTGEKAAVIDLEPSARPI